MGCFDIYCAVCGGPFTNYSSWNLPKLENIDTKWLDEAILEYYENDKKIQEATVRDYDAYGNFTDEFGVEHDVVEAAYSKKVVTVHKACHGRTVPRITPLNKYQEQFFNIDRLIADGKQHMLSKPE